MCIDFYLTTTNNTWCLQRIELFFPATSSRHRSKGFIHSLFSFSDVEAVFTCTNEENEATFSLCPWRQGQLCHQHSGVLIPLAQRRRRWNMIIQHIKPMTTRWHKSPQLNERLSFVSTWGSRRSFSSLRLNGWTPCLSFNCCLRTGEALWT